MTWQPITPRWPKKTCQWANDLKQASPDIEAVLSQGRQTLREHFDQHVACLTLTPFQPSVGQGQGLQRFLSANNLLDQLGNHLLDFKATSSDNHALVILCLAASVAELATGLGRLNTLLPIPELQRCQRRARLLATLESEKWHKPVPASLPQWGHLTPQTLPIPRNTRQALEARLDSMATTAKPYSGAAALKQLADRKLASQKAHDQHFTTLQDGLHTSTQDPNLRVRRLGPGDPDELRRQLLDCPAPGHEWIMCTGLMMVGNAQALAFVSELVGL